MFSLLCLISLIYIIIRAKKFHRNVQPIVKNGPAFKMYIILSIPAIILAVVAAQTGYCKNLIYSILLVIIFALFLGSIAQPFYAAKFLPPIGATSNFLALAANNWTMPSDPAATMAFSLKYPGLLDMNYFHSLADSSTKFVLLTDRIFHPLICPFAILCIGDVIIFSALIVTAIQIAIIGFRRSK